MQYKIIITKMEGKKAANVSVATMGEPCAVLRQLAICYRETDKKNRKNEKIKSAKAWESFTPEGLKAQSFRFEIVYDSLNTYIYEYTFTGCGLD